MYGEAKWQLTEALDLSVGGRYTNDERDGTFEFLGAGFIVPLYTPAPVRWRVVAYLENATDEVSVQVRSFTDAFQLGINATRPRTAGARISYRVGM